MGSVKQEVIAKKPAEAPKSISERVDASAAANPLPAREDINIDKAISTYNGGTTASYKWSQ